MTSVTPFQLQRKNYQQLDHKIELRIASLKRNVRILISNPSRCFLIATLLNYAPTQVDTQPPMPPSRFKYAPTTTPNYTKWDNEEKLHVGRPVRLQQCTQPSYVPTRIYTNQAKRVFLKKLDRWKITIFCAFLMVYTFNWLPLRKSIVFRTRAVVAFNFTPLCWRYKIYYRTRVHAIIISQMKFRA